MTYYLALPFFKRRDCIAVSVSCQYFFAGQSRVSWLVTIFCTFFTINCDVSVDSLLSFTGSIRKPGAFFFFSRKQFRLSDDKELTVRKRRFGRRKLSPLE